MKVCECGSVCIVNGVCARCGKTDYLDFETGRHVHGTQSNSKGRSNHT